MAIKINLSLIILLSFTSTLLISCNGDDRKAYIVYMGGLPDPEAQLSVSSLHTTMLQQVVGSGASDHLLHSYQRSFNGFVAKLTQEEAQKLEGMEGVVSVFPSEMKQIQTTRSWDFMGFSQHVVRRATSETNVIIGMIDTGIWPESQSFSDQHFGSPPSTWKGSCRKSSNFTCNNKIIGAKYYRSDGKFREGDFKSPRDSQGHGSHTSSIAAGGLVSQASLYGIATGTARGGVPSARIAVYKVCWSDGCPDADILAAFDDAIADGVDLISISIGGIAAFDYFKDTIAIGAFHAMKNGIFTSTAAGNSGPDPATVTNLSPWALSVAASTIDRKFITKVKLGNGQVYDVSDSDSNLVEGKIVVCDFQTDVTEAIVAGAAGTILQGDDFRDVAYNTPIAASYLTLHDGSEVETYLNSTRRPRGTILKTIVEKNELAPSVAFFSSRGPNAITSDILTPEITAPGVDILAAWSEATTVSEYEGDTRVVPYNIISGTSMACPHATAAAAYVKSFHPTWSPAAIKSALLTTALPMTAKNNIEQEFAYGSGHLNPGKAINPGLVYDAGEIDYVKFLCGQGYSTKNLRKITGDNFSCSKANNGSVWDLNLPSFTLSTNPGISTAITRIFHRRVTNVGSPGSIYKAIIVKNQPGIEIQVVPRALSFRFSGEKKSFTVKVTANLAKSNNKMMVSGSLIWDDGVHQVRSPIVAYIPSQSST
ncbi:hypothetical protein EZV62_025768 [Acer yangbiense]|uniref:Subtilisin-like protease fibronectin type-III domain-containing protein n=1 Tax=Acer yangbiense TaxID=1000413 RepID=A0A5C7GYX5_9ROSI|nr:hypothetical protein EZV62_025768 [Acer yangbiense]